MHTTLTKESERTLLEMRGMHVLCQFGALYNTCVLLKEVSSFERHPGFTVLKGMLASYVLCHSHKYNLHMYM